jgi:hypothetical protein
MLVSERIDTKERLKRKRREFISVAEHPWLT